MTDEPTFVLPFHGVEDFPPESAPLAVKSAQATLNGLIAPVMFGRPNITGTVTGLDFGSGGWTGGAFNVLKLYPGTTIGSESCSGQSSFMASRSSSVYGKSSTVQPSALRLIPCIKI